MNKEDKSKPSWNDAPDWANYLAQDYDGRWFWAEPKPEIDSDNAEWDWSLPGNFDWADVEWGTVIGDWRDTLEPRPESPYLPEINEECEYSLGGEWYYPCTICYRYTDYRGEHFIIGCPHLDNGKQHVSVESETQPVFFRPKKSDRELWVKAAEKVNKAHFWTQTEFLVALYDAMQSGELPVPEVK